MDGDGSFAIFESVINQHRDEIEKVVDLFAEQVLNEEFAIETPIIVKIAINFEKWSSDLRWKLALDTLLNEPLNSQKDIEICVWLMIYKSLCQRYRQIPAPQLDQIHCILRFSNLPLHTEYEFVPYRHPVRLSLSIMKCVLYSFGDCCTLLRQTIWHCPKQCPNSKNMVINVEHSNNNVGKKINKCSTCNEILQEYEVNMVVLYVYEVKKK